MADLDNSLIMAAGFAGIVKQQSGDPEVVCSRALTQGEAHTFTFTVSSVDPSVSEPAANVYYQATLTVTVVWDTNGAGGGAQWRVFANVNNAQGSASATWSASMSTDTLEVTADGDTGWLHMASLNSGAKTEFAAAVGAA